jgi:hypothetical protein
MGLDIDTQLAKCQSSHGEISGRAEKRALSANGQRNMFTGCWPGSPEELKEYWLTILSEAERLQIQLSEPEGRVLDLQ